MYWASQRSSSASHKAPPSSWRCVMALNTVQVSIRASSLGCGCCGCMTVAVWMYCCMAVALLLWLRQLLWLWLRLWLWL